MSQRTVRTHVELDPDHASLNEVVQQAGRLGEDSTGQVALTNAAGHPFFQATSVLKMILGFYSLFSVVTPILTYYSLDPEGMHMILFVIGFIMYIGIGLQYHAVRMQELWICIRAYRRQAESYLKGSLTASYVIMTLVVVLQLILAITESETGQLSITIVTTTSTVVFIGTAAAFIFILKHESLYSVDNLTA
jgi:hypothetical protein